MEGAYRVLVALDLPGDSCSGISARGDAAILHEYMYLEQASSSASPGQPQRCDLDDHKDSQR